MQTQGIHHITGIAGDAQRNLDFYAGVLGLRFIKKTVNFDEPSTYHFYFGDEIGSPGTVLTFFPWSYEGRSGHRGTGQTESFAFAVRKLSIGYWRSRLEQRGVVIRDSGHRFGEPFLSFSDHDGLVVELVGVDNDGRHPWTGVVPGEHGIRGLHSVTLLESEGAPTAAFLREQLGFVASGTEQNRIRLSTYGPAGVVDLRIDPDAPSGHWGRGTIHHVAFRTSDEQQQMAARDELLRSGIQVTPVADRQYFRSIYFHEPGGVLVELATDTPGFTIDETVAELGSGLKLPSWYEEGRRLIEARLPVVVHPERVEAQS